MARLRYNNAVGTLGASLTSSGTTITFASAPSFATITSPDFIPLILEPAGTSPSANFEIVHLTGYTAGQTTGTIVRGQEGTTGVVHSNGVAWACGPVGVDALPQTSNYVVFTSSGTWNIPTEVKGGQVRIRAIGGGGGGGAGNVGSSVSGGGGGGAGAVFDLVASLSTSDSSLTITVGAGGTGGSTTGALGGAGGKTSVTGATTATVYLQAFGGGMGNSQNVGKGGSPADSNVQNIPPNAGWNGAGGGSSGTNNGDRAFITTTAMMGGGSGGGGSNTSAGGNGGNAFQTSEMSTATYSLINGGSAGGAGGINGVTGQTATLVGCGGGGGGAGFTGGTAGSGGAGASGQVEIWW